METQILEYKNELLLVAGVLILALGIIPMVSDRWFNEMNEKFWKSKIKLFSERDQYLYNRYFRWISWLVLGTALVVYSLKELLF